MTKKRFVSKAKPGPMNSSHHLGHEEGQLHKQEGTCDVMMRALEVASGWQVLIMLSSRYD